MKLRCRRPLALERTEIWVIMAPLYRKNVTKQHELPEKCQENIIFFSGCTKATLIINLHDEYKVNEEIIMYE
jgi:hypothetical protein